MKIYPPKLGILGACKRALRLARASGTVTLVVGCAGDGGWSYSIEDDIYGSDPENMPYVARVDVEPRDSFSDILTVIHHQLKLAHSSARGRAKISPLPEDYDQDYMSDVESYKTLSRRPNGEPLSQAAAKLFRSQHRRLHSGKDYATLRHDSRFTP
jgi:hypothetical protein